MSQILNKKIEKMTVDKQKIWGLRHTAEHVLHAAMQNLYPNLKKAMGPATDEGFYFDYDPSAGSGQTYKISETDFPKIEAEMKRLVKLNLPMTQEFIPIGKARNLFKNNPYKFEWLDDIEKRHEKVSIYKMGNVDLDLCSGPHAKSTGEIKAFKLLSVAGAYWHGNEKNKMLSRIYGTAFATSKELDQYLWALEEARKRDHRKLGKQLDLFTFSDLVGSGLPLYLPKGALIRKLLNDYVEEIQSKHGYQQVHTPQINKAELFKISGHYDKYQENLFRVISNYSNEEFYLKPMNCPQHTQIYASSPRSYRDLPLRFTDFAMLYRDEKPGELNGLARVRSFSQDDCHVFCTEEQVDHEIDMALDMTKKIIETFGFKYKYRLSTHDPLHPEKYIGDPKIWAKTEKWAKEIMVRNKIEHFEGVGEAAFYAPKMDLIVTDALGREWQLSTIQIDYFMPERFNLIYTDKNGLEKRPVMIHRAIIGSAERFMMVLLEHYGGNFPTWLNPVQVKVLPITDKHLKYGQEILKKLLDTGIRAEIDDRSERLQAKIRDAQLQKVSYMLILGDKEVTSKTVSERARSGKADGPFPVETFIGYMQKEIKERINW